MKKFILSAIVIILYIVTVWGMSNSEEQLVNLYQEHMKFIDEVAQAETQEEAKEAAKKFTEGVKLTPDQERTMNYSAKMQKIIDALVPGLPHCLNAKGEPACKVYNAALVESAQARHQKIQSMGQTTVQESVLFGRAYTPADYVVKAIILFAEAFLLSWLVVYAYTKRKKWLK